MYTGPYTSRAAERTLWKEEFTSPASVHANGGVITGGAVPNFGIPLNGTTQYVTYAAEATLLHQSQFNFEVLFTPNFAAADAVEGPLVVTTPGATASYIIKQAGGNLLITVHDVVVGTIALGTYGAYWLEDEENRILVSTESGATDAWLNGTQILTAAAPAWTPIEIDNIRVGANAIPTTFFPGTIRSVKFRKGLLTALDVAAIEDGSLFTYMNRCNLSLDMAEQTERAGTILGTTELLTDGDMEAGGVAAWGVYDSGALTKEAGSPGGSGSQVLRITHGGGAAGGATQSVLTVGKRYRVRGWAQAVGGIAQARVSVGGGVIFIGTANGGWEYFDGVILAPATTFQYFYSLNLAAGDYVEFDDVECFETDELLSDGDMEETGVGAWAVGSGAPLSKEGDSYEGLQCLRITKDAAIQDWTSQNVTDINRLYHVTGVARSDGTIAPAVGNSTTYQWTGTTSTAWQPFDFWWIDPTGSGLYLYASAGGGAGNFVEFDAVSVRPILVQTLDKSSQGHVCLLGDGFTAADMPTFLNPGFGLDGTDQYMQVVDGSFLYEDEITMVAVIRPDYGEVTGTHKFLFDDTTGLQYAMLKGQAGGLQFYAGGTVRSASAAAVAPYWRTNGLNVLIGTADGTTFTFTLNGAVILDTAGAYTKVAVAGLNLWRRSSDIQFHSGEGNGIMSFPFVLSPIQRRDLTLSLGVIV